jgi:putative membrane protein
MQSAQNNATHRRLKDYFWIAARGYCMGAADVVPGVSGGTMAFILGIYEELLDAIRAVDLKFIRLLLTFRLRQAFNDFPWKFVLSLVIGIITAILTLARSLSWALEHHPTLVWSFFFGLVLASVFVVRKRVVRWNLGSLLVTALAAFSAYLLVGMVPVETPDAPWFLFPQWSYRHQRHDPSRHFGGFHPGASWEISIHVGCCCAGKLYCVCLL